MDNEAQFLSNLNITRSLTAILFTRATNLGAAGSDQQANLLRLLQRDFELMRQLCRQYQGQVIKSIGESLLMTFSSGSNALLCALKIKASLQERANEHPTPKPTLTLQHSMGIHLGEVFISDSDILGNEVNLAMQLQAEVPAGEICISQALYEIVKLNTQFSVKALGEHRLKGMTTPTLLYQVLPASLQGEPPQNGETDAAFARIAMNSLSLVDEKNANIPVPIQEIAQVLSSHPAAERAKRLLWFACHRKWESNSLALLAIPFTTVLTELQTQVPTFEALQIALQKAVSRLNKKAEYLASLELILQQVKPLYDTAHPSLSLLYAQIAQQLERQPTVDRIKKLLIWAVRERWEREPTVLHQTKIEMLLPELTIRAFNPLQLQILLHRATQSLNKSEEYQAVSDLICEALIPLYEELQGLDTAGFISSQSPATESSADPISDFSLRISQDKGGSAHHSMVPEAERANNPEPRKPQTRLPSQLTNEQSLNLRFNVMQRVNPLRLKALIYSVLHAPICFSDRSWLVLQQQFLDALLVQLMETYPNLGELSQALQETATHLNPPEEFVQIAETLVQILEVEMKLSNSPPEKSSRVVDNSDHP